MGEKLLLPVLIAIELLAVFIAMMVWTKRLLKKGRKLKENAQSPKTSLVHRSRNSMMTTRMLSDKEKKVKIDKTLTKQSEHFRESHGFIEDLYSKAKELLRAELKYDLKLETKMNQELKNILSNEYDRLLQIRGLDAEEARLMILTTIRCQLIKHPYDQIGTIKS